MNYLVDLLQGASNAAASNVSGPIDLLGFGLRKIGLPVPEDAFLSSKWMEQRGLTRKPKNAIAGLLGEAAGLSAPIAAAAKAPQIAAGLLSLDDKAMDMARTAVEKQMVRSGGIQPATVWHGSPHKFDRFDSSKIGTGEGAQAYGHGLYLAESPDVAQQYQRALSGRDLTEVGGRRVADLQISEDAKLFVQQVAANVQRGKTLDQAAGVLRKNIELGHPNAEAMQEALSVLGGGVNRGSLYKVDLPDEMIGRMLDWDKPLSQQPNLLSALRYSEAAGIGGQSAGWKNAPQGMWERAVNTPSKTGEWLYRDIADNDPTRTAEAMRKLGIPGIRYLDGGSRGTGTGTSNFVVFPGEERMLKILERNGLLVP